MRRQTWLYAVSVVVLLAGLTGSVLIYLSAMNDPTDDAAYEIHGFAAPGGGAHTKRYVHELQRYGGNAAVLADDINRFWSGLWQGEQLAYTVAVITVCLAAGFFLAARHASLPSSDDLPEKSDRTDELL